MNIEITGKKLAEWVGGFFIWVGIFSIAAWIAYVGIILECKSLGFGNVPSFVRLGKCYLILDDGSIITRNSYENKLIKQYKDKNDD